MLKGFNNDLMILTELQKMFDTIHYNILLKKLKVIGFCDGTANWLHSYLTDRRFLVSNENKYSGISKISISLCFSDIYQ